MPHVTSADGTPIGYDRLSSDGPVVDLVSGGLDDGTENLPLGGHLADPFAVVAYRRRGRGDSGDAEPYAVQREVDDLAAVINAVGGWAHLFGASPREKGRRTIRYRCYSDPCPARASYPLVLCPAGP